MSVVRCQISDVRCQRSDVSDAAVLGIILIPDI